MEVVERANAAGQTRIRLVDTQKVDRWTLEKGVQVVALTIDQAERLAPALQAWAAKRAIGSR